MDKREKLLNTALKLFVEYGFHGTPTSKIAEVAGVSNGTLFRYFKTKDDLIVSLYIHINEEMNNYLSDKIRSNMDIKERFHDFFIYAMLWHLKNQDNHHFIQQFNYSPHMALLSTNLSAEKDKLPMSIFKEGFDKNIFKPYPEEMMAMLGIGFMNGMYRFLYNKKMPVREQKKLLNETFDMFWSMLTV